VVVVDPVQWVVDGAGLVRKVAVVVDPACWAVVVDPVQWAVDGADLVHKVVVVDPVQQAVDDVNGLPANPGKVPS
jgi:hypothetical protein